MRKSIVYKNIKDFEARKCLVHNPSWRTAMNTRVLKYISRHMVIHGGVYGVEGEILNESAVGCGMCSQQTAK